MRVLLTNDDGIAAEGLQRLRRALLEVPGIDLAVIAPDGDRSAVGRGITTRRALSVERIDFGDGTHGYATDGTPVDCVRLANLGLIEGWKPDLVVSGINHGANLGDDVTYSGTVAAALEGMILGLPAIAVSQQSQKREMDFRAGKVFTFDHAARFTARLVERLGEIPLPASTMLNVNAPGGEPAGVEVTKLGKRIYRDQLQDEGHDPENGRRRYYIYGSEPDYEDEPGSDLNAVAAGRISVTPMHLDLTQHDGIGPLTMASLDLMLQPATEELR
jgi:5'-nucleotidase